MNQEQYQLLCEACDRVLLDPGSTIERVAIPWLHVIREHPVFLEKYDFLFQNEENRGTKFSYHFRNLRNYLGWLRYLLISRRNSSQWSFGGQAVPENNDVLFISHLLNPSLAGRSDDFYFGLLPNELYSHGHPVVIALINHTKEKAQNLVCEWDRNSVPRMVLASSLGFVEELSMLRCIRKEAQRLRRLARKESPGLLSKVLLRASQEALSTDTIGTLRLFYQIGKLVARMKPKAVVVTHEGHAWERLAFAAARTAWPSVKCIGYQHAALFRLQHAVRRTLTSEYNPDHILTAGKVAAAQLNQAQSLKGIPISVLGSNRRFLGASPQTRLQDRSAVCLVLPEGIASECHLLFDFSVNCAHAHPDVQFVWRLHPIIAFESLIAQNKNLKSLPPNVVLSQDTLEEDLKRCRWALYRGSTAIVPAVMAGLRPLYLELTLEMTIDPLYELTTWRVKIQSIADFRNLVDMDSESNPDLHELDRQTAIQYCDGFFSALKPEPLQRIIN